MFSFRPIINKKTIQRKSTTLQVHPFIIRNSISDFSKEERKTSFFASFAGGKAGAFFTLEAALVLPVFVCVICAFLWILTVFRVQMELQSALRTVSSELAEYAFLYEEVRNFTNEEADYIKLQDTGIERWLVGGITEVYVENEIKKQLGEDSDVWNFIEGGEDGIELESFLRIPDKNGMIDLLLVYEIQNPFLPEFIGRTEYMQRSRVRAWTGYDYQSVSEGEEDVGDIVYVTEYGKVFHIKRDCTYLELSITGVPYIASPVIYAEKKYIQCSICKPSNVKIVFVTNTGDKFHWSTSCRSLKRTIYEIPIEKVQEYAPCSRCGKDIKK